MRNEDILVELEACQAELHTWGAANAVKFDAIKESFHIVSRTSPYGEPFKILGIMFDAKLLMHEAIRGTTTEATWRLRTLLKTRRFHDVKNIIVLFKQHVLSFIESRTPGIAHAATTVLQPLDNVLKRFLREIGVTENEALLVFALAPLSTRRDIAMLGIIHRAVLRSGPPSLQQLFNLGEAPRRIGGRTWHSRYLEDPYSPLMRDYIDNSVLGHVWVYNLLPERVVEASSVAAFQKGCQSLLRERVLRPDWMDIFSSRIARASHPLR